MGAAHTELSGFVLVQCVAPLYLPHGGEAQFDAREILDQRAVILPRMPLTKRLEQSAVDIDLGRGRHQSSVKRAISVAGLSAAERMRATTESLSLRAELDHGGRRWKR